ncbi:acylneuraminate cytidylyltransferase family protein [uncultured Desulfovibrio sp.]|uniref:acylneuraminate cytidylyltransferase family protein n=1 Tax=uncultured Desulfovibrio sp. TaxID=167968 RepID=UPI0026219600|nr:acylneuraminate cytidylyltransferase family protein [uncultured Desulfovibrio sp.]
MISAIIPIKKHSQRVPQKNFRLFCGKPLFTYVISALLSVKSIDKIIINIDSADLERIILNENNSNRICIYHRPDILCGDDVSVNLLIEDTISAFPGEYFIQTHVTNPCVQSSTFANAVTTYFAHLDEYDSCLSVNKFHSRFYDNKFSPINHNINELIQTQNLPPLYEDNSCFYIFSRDVICNLHRRIGKKPLLYTIPRLESIDIDTEDDFCLAELTYEFLTNKG